MTYFSRFLLFLVIASIVPYQVLAHEPPHEIAGIKLGTNIDSYSDFEYSNYLKDIVVMDWHGFRKGIISFGRCDTPGVIVKLQMKYEDSSKSFFDTLLQRYKKKYGEPSKWEGDSFGINHIWKWYFKDDEGKKITLILQHNLQDTKENIGNQVKLYFPEMIEKERLCFLRECEKASSPEEKMRKEQLKKSSWDYLIPK